MCVFKKSKQTDKYTDRISKYQNTQFLLSMWLYQERRPSRTCFDAPTVSLVQASNPNTRYTALRPSNLNCVCTMVVLPSIFFLYLLTGTRGVIRTPLEAFRPSAEIHIRRPDKLSFLIHRRTTLPPKSGLRILYQIGVSLYWRFLLSTFRSFKLVYRVCFPYWWLWIKALKRREIWSPRLVYTWITGKVTCILHSFDLEWILPFRLFCMFNIKICKTIPIICEVIRNTI